MDAFRWLHLSDFHIGKDNYGQIKLFSYILEHIKEQREKGWIPDVIFITGDIANKAKKEEYDVFISDFLLPLLDIQENLDNVYIVPGNHDVDREKCLLAADSLYGVLNKKPATFFDTNEDGLKVRREIMDRFLEFRSGMSLDMCFPLKDMFEEKGYFVQQIEKGDKKVGIVGLNTAWLSKSDEDKEKLSPGKYMLEEALSVVKNCTHKIVLGHHPLSWFDSEQRRQICAVLAKEKAMYLHGHMHRNSGEYSGNQAIGVLTLQSGAAFQAREDEKYYNSLQWGEIDFAREVVKITPKRWSLSNQQFIPDIPENMPESFREEGTDSWFFPCFFEINCKKGKAEEVKVPTGWHLIDRSFIEEKNETKEEDILKYFDGKEPSYNDIFSDAIPTRVIVFDIVTDFVKCNEDNKAKCVLIAGAGGEGKTTVLLQTVKILVREHEWKALVLKHVEQDVKFYEESILNLTREGNWIICVDNCSRIAEKLFNLLKRFASREHQNVHLMLCARDVDWKNSEVDKYAWRDFASYNVYKLRGINEKDAELIVTTWERFGEKGLGKLIGLNTEEAKTRLVQFSKDEENKNDLNEGALLGAMLLIRYGDGLYNHIREILIRLQAISVGKDNLLNAFSYIVAMHSEKLYFLSKTVLARIFNLELKNVKRQIIGPLGDEAACAVSGDRIFTRHISIARVAKQIMDEEFHIDFDEIYIELARAAVEVRQKGEFVADLHNWRFLSDHFIHNNTSLAIRLDREILNLDPYNEHVIVHLSKSYRIARQPELSLALFRGIDYKMEHRSIFCEWALIEAINGNKATSVCLSAFALSDQVEKKQIDITNACMNLYSIAKTFLELHAQYNNNIYFQAALVAICLGERIDKTNSNIQELIHNYGVIIKAEKLNVKEREWKQILQKGIIQAFDEREIELQKGIPQIINLDYKALFMRAGIIV